MKRLWIAVLLTSPLTLQAADKPTSWLRNGGLEHPSGWTIHQGVFAAGGPSGQYLRFEKPGGANQEILAAGRDRVMTAAVDVEIASVASEPGKSGCAFAAVYQLDEDGRIVTFRDFVQARGPQPWQRHSFTFRVDPRTAQVSVRCGLFQATGDVRFDNWTLVSGDKAMRLDQIEEVPSHPAHPGSAAILSQPDLPICGKASSPAILAKILEGAGYRARLVSAEELADPLAFNTARYDLLVVPCGQAFPAEARLATVDFLRHGGNLFTTGGYAFQQLVRRVDGQWLGEEAYAKRRLEEALRKKNLLPDGGFEKVRELPTGGFALDGQWRRASDRCTLVEEDPKEGRRVAKVELPQDARDPGAHAWLDLAAEPGKTYRISGWMRTCDVTGSGIAFMAVYQHDAAGKMVEFRDFASVRGTTPWQFYTYEFTPPPQVVRLHIFFGFFQAHGMAWFDDIRLVETTGLQYRPMNTATGTPADGLSVAPTQIGIFDPSFPLKRACRIRTAPGQYVLGETIERSGEVTGWAASGLVGYDNARWIPLLETADRYGRPRGPAGAMLVHYNGPFAGSCWAFFGAENVDLWDSVEGPAARGFQQIARFMLRKAFLRNLESDHRMYRGEEPVRAKVVVDNRGTEALRGAVRFALFAPDDAKPLATVVRDVLVAPGATLRAEATFDKLARRPDLGRLAATLVAADGTPIDVMQSGVVFEQPAVLQLGPQLRFRDNYFTLNGRPTFLFGSDTYSLIYKAACENPWTWWQEVSAARDVGMNLYENLQYQNPGHRMGEEDWRAFGAVAQLVQRSGQVFMPGMLVGHNVAIGDNALEEESRLCRDYAARLGATPGLLWYINGDYQLNAAQRPEEVKTLWNR